MNKRVLFVDDEQQILDGMQRNLRKLVDVSTALGPEAALDLIKSCKEPYAVIVSDMRMPGIDGVEFLSISKTLSPDSVRVMLTGNADQETAVKALNDGEVFRFLNKPCEQETLEKVLKLALRQHQLITAEKDLLNKTLKGSIEALAEILALAKPLAFGRVKRVRNLCKDISSKLTLSRSWEIDAASMLSQLGCVSTPQAILEKILTGEELYDQELEEFHQHPSKACNLLNKIPRLENVAKIISYQNKNFDGSGFPDDNLKGSDIPFGSRVLHVVLDFDNKIGAGWSQASVIEYMESSTGKYDPEILRVLTQCLHSLPVAEKSLISIDALKNGMILEEDIYSDKDILLACRGLEVNDIIRGHLANFRQNNTLSSRKVLVSFHTNEST